MALAVSQAHTGVAGMADCGKEAAELMVLLKPGRIHHYDQMLLPRVLGGDLAARRAFLDRVLTPLDADTRNHALLDTAMALSKEGFHLQKSAERLGVHISTLRYRLEKLQAQTGLDLESADGRFQLQLATQLYLLDH
ncbi:MAG: PucR family transcriptional regulator [Nitrospirota bacterium]